MDIVIEPRARAVADTAEGKILATVDLAATPERVFEALTSREVIEWWVRPGVFDTREWSADVRVGGQWRTAGMSARGPYAIEGEFIEVDPPRTLAHTWVLAGGSSIVSYRLDPIDGGTRLTLWHEGIPIAAVCTNTAIGWETSFERLAQILSTSPGSAV
jgi:uncharacterized protein YndB with AHSA1/START domain